MLDMLDTRLVTLFSFLPSGPPVIYLGNKFIILSLQFNPTLVHVTLILLLETTYPNHHG
jgi:hypothetical protein